MFNFNKTAIEGVFIIEPKVFMDSRGFFMESYNEKEFHEAGLTHKFIQDNHSKSSLGVLRGLHFQKKHPQAKLVRAISGSIFDVAVDLRKTSSTYGKWVGVLLTDENKKMLMIPRGFAHGFLVLSEKAEIVYKCDEFYHFDDEGGIIFDDKDLNIEWPKVDCSIMLSEKDKNFLTFKQIEGEINYE